MSAGETTPTGAGVRGVASSRRVAVNTLLRAGTEVLSKLAAVVLFAVIARRLGDAALGRYIFAFAISQILYTIGDYGTTRYMLREVARDYGRADALALQLAALKGAIVLPLLLAVTAAFAAFGGDREMIALVFLLGCVTIAGLALTVPAAVFQAHERMVDYVAVMVPARLLMSLLGIVVVLAGGGLVLVAAAALTATLIGLALAIVLVSRRYGLRPDRIAVRTWPAIVRDARPIALHDWLSVLLIRTDVILISVLVATTVAGWYGAAYRLYEAPFFLSWSILFSVIPMYSYLTETSTPSIQSVFEKSLKLAIAVMAPIAVVFLVCAEGIIDLIYGLPEFAPSVEVLQVLALAPVLYAIGNQAAMLVIVRTLRMPIVWATAAALAVNVVLNLVLIGELEELGAAWAALVTQAVLAVVCLALAQRLVEKPRWGRILVGPLLGGAAMGLAMLPLRSEVLIAAASGGVVYALVFVAAEWALFRDDLALLRQMVRRRVARAVKE